MGSTLDLGVMDYEEERVRPKRYTTHLRSRFLYFNAILLFNLTFSSTFAGGDIRHHELVGELFRYLVLIAGNSGSFL